MISADTNLFLHAANRSSRHHDRASSFFTSLDPSQEFVICELVLVEIYMQLRNPTVTRKPLSARKAAEYCLALKNCPGWQHVDYSPEVSKSLWAWAQETKAGYRQVIDARLALTLLHHGVTQFATANRRDFESFGFDLVWDPLRM